MSDNVFISADNNKAQGRLLKFLRKKDGHRQNEMAKILGVSQSMISKLEKGTLELDFRTWVLVQRKFSISTYEMAYGFVDGLKPIKNSSSLSKETKHNFKISPRYGNLPGSSARATRPIIELVFNSLGYDAATKFFKEKKLDISYFTKMDNPISSNYHLDIAKVLMEKNILNKNSIKELNPIFEIDSIHGGLGCKYKKTQSTLKSVEQLISNANKYEIDKFYEIHDKNEETVMISVVPNKSIDNLNLKDEELGNYTGMYTKNYLDKYLSKYTEGRDKSKKIDLIENYTNPKHSRWLYQVEL